MDLSLGQSRVFPNRAQPVWAFKMCRNNQIYMIYYKNWSTEFLWAYLENIYAFLPLF